MTSEEGKRMKGKKGMRSEESGKTVSKNDRITKRNKKGKTEGGGMGRSRNGEEMELEETVEERRGEGVRRWRSERMRSGEKEERRQRKGEERKKK